MALLTDSIKTFWQKLKDWRTTEYYTTNIQGTLSAGTEYKYTFTIKNKFGNPIYIAGMGDFNPTASSYSWIYVKVYKGSTLKYVTCSETPTRSENSLISTVWIDTSPSYGNNTYTIGLSVANTGTVLESVHLNEVSDKEGFRIVGFEL